ncbi:MAG: class I SAM-dependent methyltransferase [Flavobacteriaceae bacterium]|nr:class I SAM-dependent methyltransferase [Flavobacteriaceae bacterium]
MNRVNLINFLLAKIRSSSYLEIGVRDGKTISKIKAKFKVGVDPAYQLKKELVLKELFKLNDFKLFKLTSDNFFVNKAKKVFPNGIDVVFVDGLHNYDQSLRDVLNSLKFLNQNGFIVLHDCNPKGAAQAYPIKESYAEVVAQLQNGGIEGWTGEWNGDVWKTIVHLRTFNPDLKVITIDSDQGLGVITFGKNEDLLKIKKEELLNANFDFLEENRNELLGLLSVVDFLEAYKS